MVAEGPLSSACARRPLPAVSKLGLVPPCILTGRGGEGGVLTYWHSARPGFSLWLRIGDLAADLTLPSPDSRTVEAPTPN